MSGPTFKVQEYTGMVPVRHYNKKRVPSGGYGGGVAGGAVITVVEAASVVTSVGG